MKLIFSELAKNDLKNISNEFKPLFLKHLEKIQEIPPRKHMTHGIPFHVEKVTQQARIIYSIEDQKLYILRCFIKHKDYERWYESYK